MKDSMALFFEEAVFTVLMIALLLTASVCVAVFCAYYWSERNPVWRTVPSLAAVCFGTSLYSYRTLYSKVLLENLFLRCYMYTQLFSCKAFDLQTEIPAQDSYIYKK